VIVKMPIARAAAGLSRTRLTALTVASLVACTGTAVIAGPTPALAASGCRAAPYSFHFTGYGGLAFPEDPKGQWNYSTTPVLKTTTQCRDINVKNTANGKIRVCVMFGKSGNKCNYATTISAGAWANAATNVKDNTYFRMAIGILYATAGYAGSASGVADF
jgi:hypothetical protein